MHQNCANFCARNHQSSAFKLHSSMIKLKSYILHFVVKDPVQCIYICSSSSCIEHVPIHHLYDDLVVESLYGSSTLYYRGRGEIQASHICKVQNCHSSLLFVIFEGSSLKEKLNKVFLCHCLIIAEMRKSTVIQERSNRGYTKK